MEQFVEHDLREEHGGDVEQLYQGDPEHHLLHVIQYTELHYLIRLIFSSQVRGEGERLVPHIKTHILRAWNGQ